MQTMQTMRTKAENTKIEIKDIRMPILKIDFSRRNKWGVVYNGIKVYASIKDKEFNKLIQNGYKFGLGDCLDVSLRITKEYNYRLNAYINRRYEIAHVNSVVPREKQIDMFEKGE